MKMHFAEYACEVSHALNRSKLVLNVAVVLDVVVV